MIYRFLDYSLDDKLFEIRHGNRLVRLERRIFDLVLYLLRNRGRIVSKSELLGHVWQGRRVSQASVTVALTAARRALDDTFGLPRVIQTHRGRGYRFIAEVTVVPDVGESPTSGLLDRFVGRRREVAELRDALNSARGGRRQVCLISGEPGIGKSRLAEEFCLVASNLGALCVTARCVEADGAPPFWPWTQVMRGILDTGPDLTSWPASIQTEIRRLVPDDTAGSDLAARDEGDPSRARFRLFDAIARVVRESARRAGLVIFIDDVHRCDLASLILLEFVAAQVSDASIVFLLADRDAETRRSEVHRDALARICRNATARILLLNGLDEAEVGEFVASSANLLDTEVKRLRELTAGNPFFLSQIAPFLGPLSREDDGATRSLPATVQDAIARQLDCVADSTRGALEVASVLGREFSEHLLALLCRRLGREFSEVSEAISSRLIDQGSSAGTYRFRHILVRDVLYERISAKQRAALHWEVAEAIEDAFGEHAELLYPEVSFHRFRGAGEGDPRKAIESCARVGSICSARLAYEEAALQFTRALELTLLFAADDHLGKCDLYLALGAEQSRSGDRDLAARSFGIAANLARAASDKLRFANAAIGSFPGFFAIEAGAPDPRVIGLLREAIEWTGNESHPLRALLLSRLGMALAWLEEGREREALCAEASDLARKVGDPGLKLQVLLARWFAEWEPTRFEHRWEIADELMVESGLHGDRETSLLCRLFYVTCVLERGDLSEFQRQVRVFVDAADNLRQPEALWYAALLRAMHALHLGKLSEAEVLSARFAEIGSLVRDANVFHSRNSHRVLLAWELAALDEMIEAASEGCDGYPAMFGWRAARAWAFARAGRLRECRADVSFLKSQRVATIPRRMDWAVGIAMLGEACVRLEEVELGRELFNLLLPLRGRLMVLGLCVATWGCASRYLGKLARLIGERERAVELLREATAIDDRVGAEAWAAWSRYELAMVLSESGSSSEERREGGDMLERLRGDAGRLGLVWLSESLEQSGHQP
jgi:DNA-binding winged helix-turn-helix (wHTH) protein